MGLSVILPPVPRRSQSRNWSKIDAALHFTVDICLLLGMLSCWRCVLDGEVCLDAAFLVECDYVSTNTLRSISAKPGPAKLGPLSGGGLLSRDCGHGFCQARKNGRKIARGILRHISLTLEQTPDLANDVFVQRRNGLRPESCEDWAAKLLSTCEEFWTGLDGETQASKAHLEAFIKMLLEERSFRQRC